MVGRSSYLGCQPVTLRCSDHVPLNLVVASALQHTNTPTHPMCNTCHTDRVFCTFNLLLPRKEIVGYWGVLCRNSFVLFILKTEIQPSVKVSIFYLWYSYEVNWTFAEVFLCRKISDAKVSGNANMSYWHRYFANKWRFPSACWTCHIIILWLSQ